MNPAGKALWYVESHFSRQLTLEEIAELAGVSRFHISRAFEAATGHSIMRYARGRRLTEAARSLSRGAPDILAIALEAGYGSHEAFTRAFRDQFGVTPETVRTQRHLNGMELVEALKMDETFIENLQPSRFENGKPLLVAGLAQRYTCETSAGIPAQWQRFLPYFCKLPGQVGKVAYGLCYKADEVGDFDYLCGVEISDAAAVPTEFARVRVPAQRYAVFEHRQHISRIRGTWNTIWNKWFPESGYEAADGPNFERYGEEFDSVTGTGGLEIWVPIKS